MTMFRKGYQLIPFNDIEDQWIPESEWTRDKIGDTQPRVVALDATFPWWVSPSKNERSWFFKIKLVLSSDIADQRILQFD